MLPYDQSAKGGGICVLWTDYEKFKCQLKNFDMVKTRGH